MEIGRRLKIARESIGYTLEKAAEQSGIGVSSLSEFENDKRELKFSQLSTLAGVYKRDLNFFFSERPVAEAVMLWREAPAGKDEKKAVEAEFRQLCQQYRRLEILMRDVHPVNLPQVDVSTEDFDYRQASELAGKVQRDLQLGDIPSTSVKQILEERCFVKIFHLSFATGSAISTVSDEFGPGVLLNKESVAWRRSFDLAHELFHLLTWKTFRKGGVQDDLPSEHEEKLANAFASRLLLPTDAVKNRVDSVLSDKRQVSLGALDEIAREFGVSIEALLWRLVYLYGLEVERVEGYIRQARQLNNVRPRRQSDVPDELPERYCSLAIRALQEGRLSQMKFAKYMRISYKKVDEYLMDEGDFRDGTISISVA